VKLLRRMRRSLALRLALAMFVVAATPSASVADEPGVDVRSASVMWVERDLVSSSGAIELARLHDPLTTDGVFGRGWTFNFDSRLTETGDATLHDDAGVQRRFARPHLGEAQWVAGARLVVAPGGQRRIERLDGSADIFDAAGRLLQRDLGGGRTLSMTRDASGRLTTIRGPGAQSIGFVYDTRGHVVALKSSEGAVVQYSFAGSQLSSVRIGEMPPIEYAYDDATRITRIADPRWGITSFVYDAQGRVTSHRFADGTEERLEFTGRSVRHIDRFGAVTVHERSNDGGRETVTDALGRKTTVDSDVDGRPVSIADAGGTSRITYDALGRTASIETNGVRASVDYLGATIKPASLVNDSGRDQFEYDAQQRLTRVLRDGQTVFSAAWSGDGMLTRLETPGGWQRQLSYDAAGRLASITDGLRRVTRFAYDGRGRPIREVDAAGGITQRQFDTDGRVTSIADPTGAVTRYEYDEVGRLTRAIDPLGRTTAYEYDAAGMHVATVDAQGRRTRLLQSSRAFRVVSPDGRSLGAQYDALGRLSSLVFDDAATRYEYDATDRLAAETTPGGMRVQYRYDTRDRITGIDNAFGATTLQWDARSRLAQITDAGGATERYAYDDQGRLVALTDPLGRTTRFGRDAAARVNAVTTASGASAHYDYDVEGRVTVVRDAAGAESRYTYDLLDRLVETRYPSGAIDRYTYDGAGRLTARTDASGRSTRYTVDASGRLASVARADGTAVRYRWTPAGLPLEIDDGRYPLRYQYDGQGWATTVEHAAIGKTVRYAYDEHGRVSAVTATSGRTVRYRFDPAGRTTDVELPDGRSLSLSYDAADRLRTLQYPNGIAGEWTYDAVGRLVSITYRKAAGGGSVQRLAEITYAYDAAGNLTEQRGPQAEQVHRFRHDADDRLVEEKRARSTATPGPTTIGPVGSGGTDRTVTYGYAPNGDRTERVDRNGSLRYAYEHTRLASVGSERFAYDADDRIVRRDGATGTTAFAYADEGRLASAESGGSRVTFGYAPNGDRISRQEGGAAPTRYVHDRGNLLEELAADGSPLALYVHAPGVDRPLAMIRGGRTFYYHVDRLGTVALMTDDTGAVAASYDTDAFGNVLSASFPGGSAAAANPFVFAAREYDAKLKLYYLRARYYDPALGRFLTPDPTPGALGRPESLNRFAYASNAPTRFTDPSGATPSPVDAAFYAKYGISPGIVRQTLQTGINYLKSRKVPEEAARIWMRVLVRPAMSHPPEVAETALRKLMTNIQARLAAAAASPVAAAAQSPVVTPAAAVPAPAAIAAAGVEAQAATSAGEALAAAGRRSVTGSAAAGFISGAVVGLLTSVPEIYRRGWDAVPDAALNVGTNALVTASYKTGEETVKQAVMQRLGGSVVSAIVPRIVPWGTVAGYAAYSTYLYVKKRQAEGEANLAEQATQSAPQMTPQNVARLLADLRQQLAHVKQAHAELTEAAQAGASPTRDFLAEPRATLEKLKALGATPDALARGCTTLVPLANRLAAQVQTVEAKSGEAARAMNGAGDWPKSKNAIDLAARRAGEAIAAARAAKDIRADFDKAVAAVAPGQDSAPSAQTLHAQVLSELQAAEQAVTAALSQTTGGQVQLLAAKRQRFEGLRADLLVRTARLKVSIPERFNAQRDVQAVETEASALKAPDDHKGLAQTVVNDSAALRTEADAALRAASTRPAPACPGTSDSPRQLASRVASLSERIRPGLVVAFSPFNKRVQALSAQQATLRQLMNDNRAQIAAAQQELGGRVQAARRQELERIVREAQQGNADADALLKKADEEARYLEGKLSEARPRLAEAGIQ
jgi:RHS repeat-associated protein